MTKESSTKDISLVLFLGGVGTAFFLLFTDTGREWLDKLGVLGHVEALPTIGDIVGASPYEFYPFPYQSQPDYIQNPNPYFLMGQPYVNIGGPIPYVHPAAAEQIAKDTSDTYWQPNPVIEWFEKLFRGENK